MCSTQFEPTQYDDEIHGSSVLPWTAEITHFGEISWGAGIAA